jgi:hypothetical protein
VLNGHALPISIIGYFTKGNDGWQPLDSSLIVMTSHVDQSPPDIIFNIPEAANGIAYQVLGIDSVMMSVLEKGTGPRANDLSSSNDNMNKALLLKYGNIVGNEFYINSGTHRISQDLVIPKNLEVYADKGTTLDLVDSASFLSYAPVYFTGSASQPVVVKSSDGSGTGFTVLQTSDTSRLHNCLFDNLSSLTKKNWSLTGAVTFYESPVTLTNVTISNNSCEDALNIIRSYFVCDSINISNTAFDGFDADFCTGIVVNSRFNKIGNDALDFSGSTIHVHHTSMNNVSDKGISAGENSTLNVNEVVISNANLGLASKDLSRVFIKNSTLKNCMTGFTAFQKKPEFGPGHIEAENVEIIDCKFPSLIEDGASLIIDGNQVK